MFNSNQMREMAHLAADRYQRAGGGGAFKVYSSSAAYHDARGYREMSPFRRAAYEAMVTFRDACKVAADDFRQASNAFDLAACERRDARALALASIPF